MPLIRPGIFIACEHRTHFGDDMFARLCVAFLDPAGIGEHEFEQGRSRLGAPDIAGEAFSDQTRKQAAMVDMRMRQDDRINAAGSLPFPAGSRTRYDYVARNCSAPSGDQALAKGARAQAPWGIKIFYARAAQEGLARLPN